MRMSLIVGDVTGLASQSVVHTAHLHGVWIMWGILRARIHQMWPGRVPTKVPRKQYIIFQSLTSVGGRAQSIFIQPLGKIV